MNIKLIYLSRNKNNNIELLVNDYEKKINHFVKFSTFCLKNKSQSNEKSQIIKSESDLILKNINNLNITPNKNNFIKCFVKNPKIRVYLR